MASMETRIVATDSAGAARHDAAVEFAGRPWWRRVLRVEPLRYRVATPRRRRELRREARGR